MGAASMAVVCGDIASVAVGAVVRIEVTRSAHAAAAAIAVTATARASPGPKSVDTPARMGDTRP
jgi:hypothetical protein